MAGHAHLAGSRQDRPVVLRRTSFMSGKNLSCIASSEAQASEIVSRLKTSGFSNNDISALLPDKTGNRDFGHEQHTKAPEGAITGVCLGGVAGAVLGWLAGIGTLALPGLGPFVAAGPIMAALGGTAAGATVGGMIGAIFGWRSPEYEARRYEGKIDEGNILISVHIESSRAAERARTVLEQCGVTEIGLSGGARVRQQ
ncbi:MAG: hypothetical protein JWR69_1758 [Pedosphaera sp.]|nr:hypothetical protein [Pedosphaera sp.]